MTVLQISSLLLGLWMVAAISEAVAYYEPQSQSTPQLRRHKKVLKEDEERMVVRWQSHRSPDESGGISFAWPTKNSGGGLVVDWPSVYSRNKSGMFSIRLPKIQLNRRRGTKRPEHRNSSTQNHQQPKHNKVQRQSQHKTAGVKYLLKNMEGLRNRPKNLERRTGSKFVERNGKPIMMHSDRLGRKVGKRKRY